jgi:hypothetical protein
VKYDETVVARELNIEFGCVETGARRGSKGRQSVFRP